MEIKRFKIADLQPGAVLNENTIRYYSSLSSEEFSRLSKPQVWDIKSEGWLLISDGNNYTSFCAKNGEEEIEVQYCGDPGNFLFLLDAELEKAKLLRLKGIKSHYDLLHTICWDSLT